jgi:hypothetical protein
MEENSYTLDTECDWCEEIKKCRGLENFPGNVVLTICEDCDSHPEFPTNINNKENVMNTTEAFTNCIAINKGNHKKCQSHQNKIIVPVMVKGGEAVHEDLYKSGNLVGWFRHELPFCIGHGNQLLKGKKIMIQSLKALPQQLTINDGPIPGDIASDGHPYHFSQFRDDSQDNCRIHTGQHADCCPCNKEEDTMSTNYSSMTIEELEELAADLFQEGAEIHQNRSAYETDEEWKELLDMTTTELTEVEEAINQKKETTMSTTKKILCGHCKEYHNTPAEVAACYGVERKPSRGPAPLIIKDHPNSKSQWFASKKDAIKFLKGLGDISKGMNPANNGNGVWAWWKTNNN